MIQVRRADERGSADHGWLKTHHTFSFGSYHNPDHMGFRSLRVMNEDRVEPGQGFGTHGHDNMEIISYVLAGSLEHKDSMGNGSVIRPGDVQRMTAGTGVTHSEFNHTKDEPVRFLQIWIQPSKRGLPPGYDQKHFSDDERRGRLRLVASPSGSEGSVRVNQDMRLYSALLEPGPDIRHEAGVGRHIWLQLIEGSVTANDIRLRSGDGAAVSEVSSLVIRAEEPSHFLLFDLA
jgi:redox-sensitive bicupin YhaK (pirin superfamily)